MNTPRHLDFPFDAHNVRVIVLNDEPMFVLADLAGLLGYRDGRDAARLLDDDEKGTHKVRTLGGEQDMLTCNEPGLYKLLFRSRRPEAKAFTRHVTHVILPAIRRTGGYAAPGARSAASSQRDLQAHRQAALLLQRLGSARKRAVQESLYAHLVMQRRALGLGTPPLEDLCDLVPPPPPAVAAFWAVVDELLATGVPLNHARDPALLAISYPELAALSASRGLPLPSKLECRAVTHGGEPRYLGARVVNSAITRLPKWAWVFRAAPAGAPPASAPQLALPLEEPAA
jgi:prophage antirepressor-like protein